MTNKEIILKVNKIITPAYLVGGAVRDELLGKQPKDYDFATPLVPDDIEERIKLSGRKAYTVGKRFGTLGFKIEVSPGKFLYVEATSFRTETYNSNSRKPEIVFGTDLYKDLSRRDFTINAICQDPKGKIIDSHGGINDLNDKCIRTVGQPKERFKDDPLRILRAGRFASQLGFKVDEYTMKKAKECSFMLYKVSKERWCDELDKTLMTDNPVYGLTFFMKTRVWNYIIPELALQNGYNQNSKYHDFSLWEHTMRVLSRTPKNLILRWSALLHDIGKPFAATVNKRTGYTNYIFHERIGAEIVLKYALYLKWSTEQKNQVIDIVYRHLKDDCVLRPYDDGGHKFSKEEAKKETK